MSGTRERAWARRPTPVRSCLPDYTRFEAHPFHVLRAVKLTRLGEGGRRQAARMGRAHAVAMRACACGGSFLHFGGTGRSQPLALSTVRPRQRPLDSDSVHHGCSQQPPRRRHQPSGCGAFRPLNPSRHCSAATRQPHVAPPLQPHRRRAVAVCAARAPTQLQQRGRRNRGTAVTRTIQRCCTEGTHPTQPHALARQPASPRVACRAPPAISSAARGACRCGRGRGGTAPG